jgi:hypothetical protein
MFGNFFLPLLPCHDDEKSIDIDLGKKIKTAGAVRAMHVAECPVVLLMGGSRCQHLTGRYAEVNASPETECTPNDTAATNLNL